MVAGEALAQEAGSQADVGTTTAPPSREPRAVDAGPADEVDQAAAIAREAFKQGAALARDHRWSDALTAFERSAEMRPHAVTTYNAAFCERALGRYTRARKLFAQALSDHKARGEVELPEDLIASADDYLAEMDRKVARIAVTLSPSDGAVAVDDAPLETLTREGSRPLLMAGTRRIGPPEVVGASSFEVFLDPGPHKFVVTRAGYRDGVLERRVAMGERADLRLAASRDFLASEGAAEHATAPNRVPAISAFGVGAAGLAVGITAGIVALGKRSQLNGVCPDKQCYDTNDGNSTLKAARTAANVSTIGLLVGAGGAAAGAAMWWLSWPRKAEPASPSSTGLSAHVGFGSVAIVKRF